MRARIRAAATAAGVLCLTFIAALSAGAWDWPSEELSIVLGFGQMLDTGGISTGVVLAGEGDAVYAAHDGELVLRFQERSQTPGQLTHPLGNFVVAEHGRSFRAVYGHLDSLISADAKPLLSSAVSLGAPGASGYATERSVLIQMRDRERDAFVNPQIMLPRRADENVPVVGALSVKSGATGRVVALSDRDVIPAGAAAIYVTCYDITRAGGVTRRIPPYRIDLSIDGELADSIHYETVHATEQGLELGGRVPTPRAAAGQWQLYAGAVELEPGIYTVSVTVSDFAGNQAGTRGSLTVAARE